MKCLFSIAGFIIRFMQSWEIQSFDYYKTNHGLKFILKKCFPLKNWKSTEACVGNGN